MVPLARFSSIGGIPLPYFLSQEQIDRIVARTRDGGAEIVRYLKTGSAYYAPGASACKMAQAIVRDAHHIYPASVYLQGEYGLEDICFGVPVVLGKGGVERIIQLDLNDEEKAAMKRSADLIRGTMASLKSERGVSYQVTFERGTACLTKSGTNAWWIGSTRSSRCASRSMFIGAMAARPSTIG